MITSEPIEAQIMNAASQVLPLNLENGTVTINGVNASKETYTADFTLYQNSPNPFSDLTYISFDLKQTGQAALSIHDSTGKVIFEKNELFTAGAHSVPVSRDLFQSAGAYFFTLKTSGATATRQLIAQ